jgi:uncharacterized membrane protein YedE/YeeE
MAVTLAVAGLLGVAFGALLECAGLGQARTLVGQFYFRNLIVLKVLFSALLTAMIGAFWLDWIGVLDLRQVYLPETFAAPQAIGGVLFGAGLILAGLCPGTACVAAVTGRRDGFAVMAGLAVGMLAFDASFAVSRPLFESTSFGVLTLPQLLHVSRGMTIAAITGIAIAAFLVAERLRLQEDEQ